MLARSPEVQLRFAGRAPAPSPRRLASIASTRAVLAARARHYIARHADDADLTVDAIANALRCTKRHLHRAFAEQDETVSAHLWTVRLERCRDDLDHASGLTASITEIAFSWGFNSSSHFSRMFKARFGVPPRVYRAGIAPAHGTGAVGAPVERVE